MKLCVVLVALTTLAWLSGGAGASGGEIAELDESCPPRGGFAGSTARHAYFVMIGPFSKTRTYTKWLFAVVALRNALRQRGSTADFVCLCALRNDNGHQEQRMLPSEESLLLASGIRWRYVRAPFGQGGFHMGHFKLWAWQHTEYERIQLLDADLMPLTNLDQFFHLPIQSDYIGCPGKVSTLNAGWFSLRPSCEHFAAMTTLVNQYRANKWDKALGWGHELVTWRNAQGVMMKQGWDFFDSRGNQGHMYSYFVFDAADLTLIFDDRIVGYYNRSTTRETTLFRVRQRSGHDGSPTGGWSPAQQEQLRRVLTSAYPCPFPPYRDGQAYHHFTGALKPWSAYKPSNPAFKLWYDAVEAPGTIDVKRDVFKGQVE